MKTAFIEKLYERDPVTKEFLIKISISRYTDIFNDLDPAPFKKRDLDPDVISYLEDCSIDIPLKYKIKLQFNAPKEIQDDSKEKKVIVGLETYFQFLTRSFKRKNSQLYRRSIIFFIISSILLIIASYAGSKISEDFLFITLVEGLYIGGWVFLWEGIVLLLFENREVIIQRKRYERLNYASINFLYQ